MKIPVDKRYTFNCSLIGIWKQPLKSVYISNLLSIFITDYKVVYLIRAADPCLCLRIDPMPLEHVEEWDLVNIPAADCKIVQPKEVRSDPSIQAKIMTKVSRQTKGIISVM